MSLDVGARVWDGVLNILSEKYTIHTMDLWFNCTSIKSIDSEYVTLLTVDGLRKTSLEKRYAEILTEAFEQILGFKVQIRVQTPDNLEEVSAERNIFNIAQSPDKSKDPQANNALAVGGMKQDYTFNTFVVGSSNQVAQAAALSVAKHPADFYNPLFIYGPSGLGKTHLLFAILNHVKAARPEYSIRYCTGEQFTNELIEALSSKENVSFREKYRKIDMLLVDDVHFIAGKPSIQEEFFNTFNELYMKEKQIVLTSDRPPLEMPLLEDRLKTRFSVGLLVDIQPPDSDLRSAIFKMKSKILNMVLPNDVLLFLAENIKNNIRQIEGALKRLSAQSFITSQPISLQMARDVLSDFFTENNSFVTMEKIFAYMTKRYGIRAEDLKSKKRNAEVVYVRHIAMFLALELAGSTLKNVGRHFERDHTTVMNARDNVLERMKKDVSFDREIKEVIKELTT